MNFLRVLGGVSLVGALALAAGCNKGEMATTEESKPAPVAGQSASAGDMAQDKPFAAYTQELTLTAKVAGINHETRELVLVDEGGFEQTFVVGEEARNLDQVSVGDMLTINYLENITIKVVDGTNMEAGAAVVAEAVRSKEGEMPAGAMGQTQVEVYMVEAINLESNTFVLKDAAGNVKEFTARNPENLKRSSVGDAVVMSVTKVIAVDVAKAETP
ncbi:hypothetical protein [Aestuariirhabdus sp. LZHN29]|uniref:hypothetical protein n=1 Tax=Aestuariirhabdus sp. LZHN29 TaxID=3417462 RepID=UPI003CF6F776